MTAEQSNVAPPDAAHATHAAQEDHKPISRAIYGLITVLAVLQVLDLHPPGAWQATFVLFGTTLAVALADAYAESIAVMLTTRRAITRADLQEIGREIRPIMAGAQPPTVLLLLAALGLWSVETAISLAEMMVFALLFGFGLRVGSLLHGHWFRQLLNGVALVALAGLVVGIKVLFH